MPTVQTYINPYSSNRYTVEAVEQKLVGGSEFTGASPVDPFRRPADTQAVSRHFMMHLTTYDAVLFDLDGVLTPRAAVHVHV